jgi:hypothetical protein
MPRAAWIYLAVAWNALWLGTMILPHFLSSSLGYATAFAILLLSIGLLVGRAWLITRRA